MANAAFIDNVLRPLQCYNDKPKVRRDVSALLKQRGSLKVGVGTLVHNDGRSSTLMQLTGTLPIRYQGAEYHIPVTLWLLENHPLHPPRCYVSPTRDMRIKPRHLHVDTVGLVYLPYLNEWNASRSTLPELATCMVSVFSTEPPVYRAPDSAQPNANHSHPHSHTPAQQAAQRAALQQYQQQQLLAQQAQHKARLAAEHSQAPFAQPNLAVKVAEVWRAPAPVPIDPVERAKKEKAERDRHAAAAATAAREKELEAKRLAFARHQEAERQKEVRKKDLIQEVTGKLQESLQTFYGSTTREIDTLFEKQRQLQKGSEELSRTMGVQTQFQTQLRDATRDLRERTEKGNAWLDQQDGKDQVDVREMVRLKDTWSQQMVELIALDAALEDCIDELGTALADDRIKLDSFLKETRKLARQQFNARALAFKIYEMQGGAQ